MTVMYVFTYDELHTTFVSEEGFCVMLVMPRILSHLDEIIRTDTLAT